MDNTANEIKFSGKNVTPTHKLGTKNFLTAFGNEIV